MTVQYDGEKILTSALHILALRQVHERVTSYLSI